MSRCDTTFQTPGTFATMRDLVAREVWPSYFAPVIELEATAIRIHEWEMRVVPGLLQTEDYARAVISAGKPRDTSAAIDRAVSARLERQAILNRENPPMLWHVLHEGVLRHVVGSPAIMREQLDKLAGLAREPGVVIQILPFTASDHPGTDGPILVYDFDGASSVGRQGRTPGASVADAAPRSAVALIHERLNSATVRDGTCLSGQETEARADLGGKRLN